MDDCLLEADNAIGPVVSHCRGGFDFTLLFEQAILSLVPSALVLAAAFYRLLVFYRRPTKIVTTPCVLWVTAKQVNPTVIGRLSSTSANQSSGLIGFHRQFCRLAADSHYIVGYTGIWSHKAFSGCICCLLDQQPSLFQALLRRAQSIDPAIRHPHLLSHIFCPF